MRLPNMLAVMALSVTGLPGPAFAAQASGVEVPAELDETYADLAELIGSSQLVARVRVQRQIEVEPERAPGLAPGYARIYIEAETVGLLAGSAPVGGSLVYLVDLPRDSKGKVPRLKKTEAIVFASPVAGRPGELQLADPGAQLPWSAALEERLRPILAEFFAADAMPPIGRVREALSVAGNLDGESETQIFLTTEGGDPVSLSVVHRPGMAPQWGMSRSEIIDQAARPPQRETLEWYRLACFLPRSLPSEANLASDSLSRRRAAEDYAFVIAQLGPCERNRS